jgi:hypothetical protein
MQTQTNLASAHLAVNSFAEHGSKDYLVTRSESMDGSEVGSFLTYFINLDERGEFYADVRNAFDKTVFEISGFEIFEDGFMSNKDDLEGLSMYLVQLGVMAPGQALVKG